MGNAQSQQKKSADMYFNEELINSIDLLASKLIFEQSFQNLKKLDDPRYCNEVSILTQQLLKKKLDPININIVSTRIKYGTQDLYVIDDNGYKQLKKVNHKGDKDALCLNVSRFYTRVFQAYSAIVSAISPVYVYKDIEGTEKVSSVFDEISSENKNKADIGLRSLCSRRIHYLKPKTMGEKQMKLNVNNCKMNVKNRKIPILTKSFIKKQKKEDAVEEPKKEEEQPKEVIEESKKEEELTEEPKKKEEVAEEPKKKEEVTEEPKKKEEVTEEPKQEEEQPKEEPKEEPKKDEQKSEEEVTQEQKTIQMGGVNEVSEGKVQMTSDLIETMTLADEPGIKSLENLYKDFMKIEIEGKQLKGVFVMSDKSKKQYEKDVKDFYKAFVPANQQNTKDIKEFSDIKLTDYTKMKECNDKKAPWGAPIIGDASKRKDSLFIKYGTHFQTMIKNVKDRETELIGLLHRLFDFDLKKDVPIKIKGDLTEDKLNNEIMKDIQNAIKKMYIGCEMDFQRGIQIYNEIYKQRNNM